MPRRDMGNLVADHGGELILVLGNLQDARKDPDLAARHCECIDRFTVEHREFPLDIVVRWLEHVDNRLGDTCDEIDLLAVGRQWHPRAHLIERPCALRFKFRV